MIKVTALSLTEVFKDLVPLFALDKTSLEGKLKEVIKKEERKIIQHEYSILTYYEKFL